MKKEDVLTLEAYLEPYQTFMMEFFSVKVTIFIKSLMIDVCQLLDMSLDPARKKLFKSLQSRS